MIEIKVNEGNIEKLIISGHPVHITADLLLAIEEIYQTFKKVDKSLALAEGFKASLTNLEGPIWNSNWKNNSKSEGSKK